MHINYKSSKRRCAAAQQVAGEEVDDVLWASSFFSEIIKADTEKVKYLLQILAFFLGKSRSTHW